MDRLESQAIAACQAGNLTQFTLLYERYADKLYRFVYFKTWHRETAEDLVSVAFMKALENIAKFDSSRGNFSSWLYRIAHNTVIDHYRTAKPTLDIDEIFGLSAKTNLAEETQINRSLAEVKDYLLKLDQATRDLIIMRLWQGLSYQEIADITGKSAGSLKMAASRALRELRASLSPLAWWLIISTLN